MPTSIPFLKMHGLGNDFVLIDDLAKPVRTALTPEISRKLCDRRFGVGADQILWMVPAEDKSADARMDIRNSDGSTAEMCGNGIRAAALYLHRHGPKPGKSRYVIETLAGLKPVEILGGSEVTVDMGAPGLGAKLLSGGEVLEVAGQRLTFFEVSMGNPHAVFFVDDVAAIQLEKLGPEIERHSRFPKKTNVEFVQVISSTEIRVRVWERGAGITLACGTGACASAVGSLATDRTKGLLTVVLPGGELKISWAGEGQPVMMTGPAKEVFRGEFLP